MFQLALDVPEIYYRSSLPLLLRLHVYIKRLVLLRLCRVSGHHKLIGPMLLQFKIIEGKLCLHSAHLAPVLLVVGSLCPLLLLFGKYLRDVSVGSRSRVDALYGAVLS